MSNKKTKKIEVRCGCFEEFEVIDIDVKVGQHIWFDEDGWLMEAVVNKVEPDHWWIYDEYEDKDNPRKVLGCVSCEVINPPSWMSHPFFQVDFCDIMVEKPENYKEYSEDDDSEEQSLTTMQMLDALPSNIILNDDELYTLDIQKASDNSGDYKGWYNIQYRYDKIFGGEGVADDYVMPPMVKGDGESFYLISFMSSFDEAVKDMYERLTEAKLLNNGN